MKYYYYAHNNQRLGPFTIDELKSKRLKRSTLIWTDGMADWASADKIDELIEILVSEPPPLPSNIISNSPASISHNQTPPKSTNSKYDLTYTKETGATVFGIVLFIIPITLKFTDLFTFETEESYNEARAFLMIAALGLRVAVTFWIVKIATAQNRNTIGWGWFAFLLPSISLIVIGQLNKLRLKLVIDKNMPLKQQVSILLLKANKFYFENRWPECLEILTTIIRLDDQCKEALKLRAYMYYQMNKYDLSKVDFENLYNSGSYLSFTNYYLGHIELKNYNRVKAVHCWLSVNVNEFKDINVLLDLYHNFTGKYVLALSQVNKKIGNFSTLPLFFLSGIYTSGINQIDEIENINLYKTQIRGYKNGLEIQLQKANITLYIGIAYYEMQDILYNTVENRLSIVLSDKSKLEFNYNKSLDKNGGLKSFYKKFQESTGKLVTSNII